MLTHIGTAAIETERLVLCRFLYTDADAMLNYWIADEKIQSMYSEPVYTTKEAVNFNAKDMPPKQLKQSYDMDLRK